MFQISAESFSTWSQKSTPSFNVFGVFKMVFANHNPQTKSCAGPFLYPTANVFSCMICSMVYASSWYSSLISCWRSKAFIIIATHHQSIIIVLCLVLFLGGSSPWHSSVTNYAKNDTEIFSGMPKKSCIHIPWSGHCTSCEFLMTRKINYLKMDYQEIVTVLRYTLICIILHTYR